jgi:NAD-dependent SIR2 family protein deacetylase
MQECQNCGSDVTDQYARVFAPPGIHGVRVCPGCEDKIRDGKGQIREAHSPRYSPP